MPLTPAYHKLTHHKPVNSLFSFSIVFSMGIQTLFVCIFQTGAHLFTSYYFPKKPFLYFRMCNADFDNYRDLNGTKPWLDYIDGEEEEDEGQGTDDDPDEPVYMECIYNSTNFYVSFAQYLILAVVFCSGKPFKKNIIYNYGMIIFAVIGFLYSEYIVLYVDKFSRKFLKITPYPDDRWSYFYNDLGDVIRNHHSFQFKFIIMITLGVNFLFCLFLEKVVVHYSSISWRRKRMDKNRKKLEADINKESTLSLVNEVKNYIKEQKAMKKIIN
jgi:magnesium-transporting ATPase (P-type)